MTDDIIDPGNRESTMDDMRKEMRAGRCLYKCADRASLRSDNPSEGKLRAVAPWSKANDNAARAGGKKTLQQWFSATDNVARAGGKTSLQQTEPPPAHLAGPAGIDSYFGSSSVNEVVVENMPSRRYETTLYTISTNSLTELQAYLSANTTTASPKLDFVQ